MNVSVRNFKLILQNNPNDLNSGTYVFNALMFETFQSFNYCYLHHYDISIGHSILDVT